MEKKAKQTQNPKWKKSLIKLKNETKKGKKKRNPFGIIYSELNFLLIGDLNVEGEEARGIT